MNLGNPRETSMLELATMVCEMLLDGWAPKVPLEQGLGATVEYFRGRVA